MSFIAARIDFVSTHSRLKAAGAMTVAKVFATNVSTHSRLKAAGTNCNQSAFQILVSTHSRLKAAGSPWPIFRRHAIGFQHTAA